MVYGYICLHFQISFIGSYKGRYLVLKINNFFLIMIFFYKEISRSIIKLVNWLAILTTGDTT